MEVTIEEALQRAINAHRHGQIQDAERIYRAILLAQPKHSDANHNLGVLMVAVNKPKQAETLFKKAIESNPSIAQFWLSYIDVLIRIQKPRQSAVAIDQARSQGVDEKLLTVYVKKLESLTFSNEEVPSDALRQQLLKVYQEGRLNQAEQLARQLSTEYPRHQFAWKVLGAVLKQTGRFDESLAASKESVRLIPGDASAHNNLGITLQEMGRLEDAVSSYMQALQLNPNYAEAHNNLGISLSGLGKLNQALDSYMKAISIKPSYAEAHCNLGNALQELGRVDEAEKSLKKALELNPSLAAAHGSLGNLLRDSDRISEATECYTRVVALMPSYDAYNNLGNNLAKLDRLVEAEDSYKQAIKLEPKLPEAHYNLAIMLKTQGQWVEAQKEFELAGGNNAESQSLECLYHNKDYEEFNSKLISISKRSATNIRLAAVSAFVSHQMDKADPYQFCPNPLDFVLRERLDNYDSNPDILISNILREAEKLHSNWESATTKNGFQSSSKIFENPGPSIAYLETIISKVIDEYFSTFKHHENTFIGLWPNKNKIRGHFNRLLKNGYQTPHIHSGGWLSGVIYLKTVVPKDSNEGAIEFGLHGYDLPIVKEKYPRLQYTPKSGDIILFPSSLFHGTIPFYQDTERCVIAFDLLPAK